MNKVELIKDVAGRTGFTQKDVKTVMEAVQAATFAALVSDGEVKLIDGVTLLKQHKEAHTARNPQTCETIMVEAKNVVKCKFGKAIKDAVNE